ncbi:MAG: hypothetical protein INR68_03420 [Methylobacterium mesophilicum]|nr:hypothetical protein [Methylobacterium mesophilicum]
MRLTPDEIVLGKGAGEIRLHPSLRAAMRLHQTWGIKRVKEGIERGSLSVIVAIVEQCAEDRSSARDRLARLIEREGALAFATMRPNLHTLIDASFGLWTSKPSESSPAVEHAGEGTMRFSEFFEQLFEIGTGWLEWSPAQTYAATPAEILIAQRGKIALLRAIHGSAEKEEPSDEYIPDTTELSLDEVRGGLNHLKGLVA